MADLVSGALRTSLKRYRERAHLTQEELAERAGLSVEAISSLERGTRRRPQIATLRQIADALGLADADRAAILDARLGDPPAEVATPRAAIPSLLIPPTPLIGREREEAAIVYLLRQPTIRLLTLTGPGGAGKTRLALQVATTLREAFPDGVALVALGPLRDPRLVAATIAAALDLPNIGNLAAEERIAAFLGPKSLLLVLDNLEHLLEAAGLLARLVATCPSLRLLVTSRAPLRVQGEQEFAVRPLDVPARGTREPERVAEAAAVKLFVQRARAVRPEFVLDPTSALAVAEICRRLDGLPLAIELVAARTRVFSPRALLARLDIPPASLDVATGGARDLPARQRTLRETIAWSEGLLTLENRNLFHRLAVFAGGFSVSAVNAVAGVGGATPEAAVEEGLAALVEQSLLFVEPDPGGEPHYGMLETIRAFAWERLEASGEAKSARARHAAYYLALAVEAEPHLVRREQVEWLDRLEVEHENLRVALRWSVEGGDLQAGLRAAAGLRTFWWLRGHAVEERRWQEALLATPGAEAPTAARAKALVWAGMTVYILEDWRRGKALMEEGLALARRVGSRPPRR